MYIIRNLLRYIIRPKVWISSSRRGIHGFAVMIYSPEGADDMHDCVVMIYQACGLNKKILVPKNEDFLVGEAGFGPAKSVTTDLQSAPFGRSGIPPYYGAGDRSRTNNLLITNQLLCH